MMLQRGQDLATDMAEEQVRPAEVAQLLYLMHRAYAANSSYTRRVHPQGKVLL